LEFNVPFQHKYGYITEEDKLKISQIAFVPCHELKFMDEFSKMSH